MNEHTLAQQRLWSGAAPAWRRWHDQHAVMSRPVTQLIVDEARLGTGMRVLDLAGGTGEPSLTAAAAVGAGGHVAMTDISPQMIDAARHFAARDGRANMSFHEVNIEAIPFADASFDRATCRFGIMFVPDTLRGLSEIRRVLRPDGHAAFAVWSSPARNPFISDVNSVLARHGLLRPPPPDAPGIFRFAEPGSLSARLDEAGFRSVRERIETVPWHFPGSLEDFFDFLLSGTPMGGAINAVAEPLRSEILAEARQLVAARFDGAAVRYEAEVIVAAGDC